MANEFNTFVQEIALAPPPPLLDDELLANRGKFQRFLILTKIAFLSKMDKKVFKVTVSCLGLLAYPICILLAIYLKMSIFFTILIISQFLLFILLFPRSWANCLRLYKRIKILYHLPLAICTVVFSSAVGVGLAYIPAPYSKVLLWSWLQYFTFGDDESGGEDNLINFGFASSIIVSVIFFILILLVLPVAAYFEEVIFRRGTKNWFDGTLRSLVFGLVHTTMGVPLIIALVPLSLLGAFLTREYFEGMRRFREQKLRSKPLGDPILDDVEGDFYDQCSWNPLSGHIFSRTCQRKQDGALEAAKDIFDKTSLALDPNAIKNEGSLSSTLLHLAHNTIAIVATFIILIASNFVDI